jgi:hydroxylamine reductase
VLALADKVVDAVKSGAIRKFVVMAGCDGRMKNRNYYTEFAEQLPDDCVILTAGCAKYRYNKLPLGDINGIPRVLDAGQCNDSYSLALIAMKLQDVFGLEDINQLPIVYNIAWYEQKAVIVLLALLSLGVKNIHLGPTLPAFLSPNVAKVLVENFGIDTIQTPEKDRTVHHSIRFSNCFGYPQPNVYFCSYNIKRLNYEEDSTRVQTIRHARQRDRHGCGYHYRRCFR